jgi:hypothetical protein
MPVQTILFSLPQGRTPLFAPHFLLMEASWPQQNAPSRNSGQILGDLSARYAAATFYNAG